MSSLENKEMESVAKIYLPEIFETARHQGPKIMGEYIFRFRMPLYS